jgi:hypothetical protein
LKGFRKAHIIQDAAERKIDDCKHCLLCSAAEV